MQFSLEQAETQLAQTVRELAESNRMSGRYGLTLTPEQMRSLAERRGEALRNTGRVEFGGGMLRDLIHAFCDSPNLIQTEYEAVLTELQDLFYEFKNETEDRLSDEELLHAMRSVFDRTGGSLERLAETSPGDLERLARGKPAEEDEEEEDGDADDKEDPDE